jgi:hypothetical protein
MVPQVMERENLVMMTAWNLKLKQSNWSMLQITVQQMFKLKSGCHGEYKNQFNTALTGYTGAEFLPQQSAGISNFDFGEKADDFAKESSANNDFDSS